MVNRPYLSAFMSGGGTEDIYNLGKHCHLVVHTRIKLLQTQLFNLKCNLRGDFLFFKHLRFINLRNTSVMTHFLWLAGSFHLTLFHNPDFIIRKILML